MKTKILLKMIYFILLAIPTVIPAFAENGSFSRNQTPFGIAAPDLYWLSYVENSKGVFLMQIDSTGKVIRAPVSMGQFGPAISRNGANHINLWGEQRVVLNKKTLSIVKRIKNPIGSPNSITNKTQNNFASIVGEEPLSLSFFGVSPIGVPNGATWEIASSVKGFCYYAGCPPGAISSDGKTILWIVLDIFEPYNALYVQQLFDTGRPNGSQKLVGSEDGDLGEGAISNVLASGHIYIIYTVLKSGAPRQLILQHVDAQTENKIGDRILLAQRAFGFDSIAIDPFGRFVVFAHRNQQNVGSLSFLALDATGHPSGTSKVLVRKVDAYDIHLLKD